MNSSEFQTEPNNLRTAVDGMIDGMLLEELDNTDLTLADIAEECPHPKALATHRETLEKFLTSPQTSTDVLNLSEGTCRNYGCKIRQDCMRVLNDGGDKTK